MADVYLQRLIADDEIGFNYDPMGYAEYETGATRAARLHLGNLLAQDQLTWIEARLSDGGLARSCLMLGPKANIAEIADAFRRKSVRNKGPLGLGDAQIIGWLPIVPFSETADGNLGLLLARPGDDTWERIERFLKPAFKYGAGKDRPDDFATHFEHLRNG